MEMRFISFKEMAGLISLKNEIKPGTEDACVLGRQSHEGGFSSLK